MIVLLLSCAARSDIPPDPLPDPPRRGVTLTVQRDLAAPPSAVWPHLTEPALLSAWSRTRIEAHAPVDGDPSAPGAVRRVTVQALGERVVYEVIVANTPGHLRYRVFSGGGLRYHHGDVVLVAADGGSRLTWQVRLTPHIPGSGLLIRGLLRRQFEADLAVLAEALAEENP